MFRHSRRWLCSCTTFSKVPYGNSGMVQIDCLLNMLTQGSQRMHCVTKSSPLSASEHANCISSCDDLKISLQRFCLADRILEATEFLNDMKKQTLADHRDFELIIDGYLRKNDVPTALELLSEMNELGLSLTATGYSQMVQCLLKSGDHNKACKIYAEMLNNNIDPEISTTTAMIHGHLRHANVPEAWKIFEKIKNGGSDKPVKEVYSFFIAQLCWAFRPEEAFKLLIEMSKVKIHASNKTIHLVTSCLIQKLNIDTARKIDQVDKLDNVNMQKDEQMHTEDISLVMSKESNQSYGTFQHRLSSNGTQMECNRDDVNEVCQILCSSKNWNSIMGDLENSAISFTPELVYKILYRCQKHGHIALHFFSWLENREGYVHNSNTYNMAIKISGSAKDFKHMRNLYLEMRRRRCPITPDTWTIMICQYGQAGLTEMALKKLKEMKLEGHIPKASTYKFLIIFLCGKKGRKANEAVKIFHEMVHSGYLPDKETVEIYLSCLCESNEISQARKSAEFLCAFGFPVQISKSLLVRSLCRAGKLEDALKLADQMEGLGYPLTKYIYGSLVHGLLRAGRLDEAMVKVKEMENAGISRTVHIYTSLMVHYLERQQMDKANDTLKRMVEDGCRPTVVTYSALIHGLVSNDMISDAWNIFKRMKTEGPLPDFKTYSMFIASLCKVGRSEEGLLLLHEMIRKEILPSAVNFKTVLFGLNREGKKDLAISVMHMKWGLSRKRKFLA